LAGSQVTENVPLAQQFMKQTSRERLPYYP
jgi:hypothetical protein